MAYTQTDLDSVSAAITRLAGGARVAKCTYDGTTVEYAPSSLPDLLTLRSIMQADVARAAGKSRYAVVSTSKGL